MGKKIGAILLVGLMGVLLVGGIRQLFDCFERNQFIGIILLFLWHILAVAAVLVVQRMRRMKPAVMVATEDWFWAAFAGWGMGGSYSRLTGSKSTFEFQLHDTYFVIANVHACTGIAIVFGIFALIYHYRARLQGAMGMIHFWMTFLASLLAIWPNPSFPAGMPRRYMDYSSWISFNAYDRSVILIDWVAMSGIVAQVVFLTNLVYSALRRRKSVD